MIKCETREIQMRTIYIEEKKKGYTNLYSERKKDRHKNR